MTTILLGSGDKNIKSTELFKTLIRLLYGAHDLETALVRFNTIYSCEVKGTDDMIAEFDAHVGDCGCHLRAQMLWRLIEHYHDANRREWIDHAIQTLRDIKRKIVALYSDIRRLKGDIRLLGFSASISLVSIFDRIGCKHLFTILDDYLPKIDLDDEHIVSATSDVSTTSYLDSKDREPPVIHRTSCCRHRIVKADKWNLSDYRMLARFLAYCRVLSFHKTATLEPGAIRVRYRLDPLFAFSETEMQLDRLNLIDGDLLSKFITLDERPSRRALVKEIENMQIYITQLTCDWMTRLSYEMDLGHPIQRLLQNSIQISKRELHCMSTYSSILVMRFEWFVKDIPLFLVVRRYCSYGYHNMFYRVSVNLDAVHPYIEAVRQDNSKIVEVGNANWFCLTLVSLNSVLTQDWAHQPHLVLIANSIAGSMADFYSRMGSDNYSRSHTEACSENDEFVKNEFPSINFSQAIMYFFSSHDQYPFDLPANENEWDVIEKTVDSTLGREAAATYRRTVNETCGLGAECTALGLLNFQHIFAEFPVIVGRQTEQIILRNEKPAPYGYHWANTTDVAVTSDQHEVRCIT